MTVRKNVLLIVIFIFTVLALFINKLTTPRVLSSNELLINGLFYMKSQKKFQILLSLLQTEQSSIKQILKENGR